MTKKLVSVNMTALVGFALILGCVVSGSCLEGIDERVYLFLADLRKTWFDGLIIAVTHMNGLVGAGIFSVGVSVWFVSRRWYCDLGFFLVVTLGATGLFALIKNMVHRVRPPEGVIDVSGFSFPSGHTTMATAMAFALYFIFWEKTQNRTWRLLLWTGASAWAATIAFSRVYLGVHWLSDVLGGLALGIWWVTLVRLLWTKTEC